MNSDLCLEQIQLPCVIYRNTIFCKVSRQKNNDTFIYSWKEKGGIVLLYSVLSTEHGKFYIIKINILKILEQK